MALGNASHSMASSCIADWLKVETVTSLEGYNPLSIVRFEESRQVL